MGGMTRLLLLLWVGVTASTVVDLQKRVIGGSPCKPDQRQYHVKLRGSNGVNTTRCGGSLINNQWILTATHCWVLGGTMTAYFRYELQPVRITASPEIFRYNETDKRHDIMLLKLPDGTPIPTHIKPVRLPDCGQRPNISDEVQIAGYGATEAAPNGERLDTSTYILHCADTDIVDCQRTRDCLQIDDPDFYEMIGHAHWICGQRDEVDISPGDSGSGVEYKEMIYGVISFSGNETHACTAAAGFMDVCEYMEWINETIAPPRV